MIRISYCNYCNNKVKGKNPITKRKKNESVCNLANNVQFISKLTGDNCIIKLRKKICNRKGTAQLENLTDLSNVRDY